MVTVLKTVVSISGTVGSNPTPSACSNFWLHLWEPIATIYTCSFQVEGLIKYQRLFRNVVAQFIGRLCLMLQSRKPWVGRSICSYGA